MAKVIDYLPILLHGAWVTIQITALSAVLAGLISFLVGFARVSKLRPVRWLAVAYGEFFRGTSLLIQLFWAFYVLPLITPLLIPPYTAGVIVLGLNLGAYGSEVVRGAIQAVPQGQRDASTALNFTPWQQLRIIILPQMLTLVVAPFGNLLIVLLKATSLVSLITIADLTFAARNLRASEGNTALILAMAMCLYFAMSLVIAGGSRATEHHLARLRGLTPTRTVRDVSRPTHGAI